MALSPGTRLGPYEILAPIGAGGMGEVYRARDTRLDRTVAIKVLPERLSASPELKQRFEREARAISALSHPNICALHDVGEQDGMAYLVMEHLEGETLAARLQRAPIPLSESLRIAAQIAEALDRAHRQGVIHRDLKPGNVMLTKTGAKLLDFGLAKVAGNAAVTPLTTAPTATSPLTAQGTIVGTFQYMAPEQLEGAEATARSDIFAFGVLLYEMLSGQRPFEGKTHAGIAAAILKETPRPLSAMQPMMPPALERLVATCLEKDPDERRQSMHDVLLELRWVAEGGSATGIPAPTRARRRSRESVAWGIAALAIIGAIGAGMMLIGRPGAGPLHAMHVSIPPPAQATFEYQRGPMAISPDGSQIVFVAREADGTRRLWLRSLDAPVAKPIEGTLDAAFPFWSSDSRSIAFAAQGKLKRVEAAGGAPDIICDLGQRIRGGDWGSDGTILISTNNAIQRVAASGGELKPVALPESGDTNYAFPSFLPDGRHFLIRVRTGTQVGNHVAIGSLEGGKPQRLLETNSNAVFVQDGYILFWRDDALRAQAFDPRRLALSGEPYPVAPGTRFDPGLGYASFSVSRTGILVYHTGESSIAKRQLVLRSRDGKQTGTVSVPGNYYAPRFSHDGRRVAVDNSGINNNGDIWLHGVERSESIRVIHDPTDDSAPVWSPDDQRIAFFSARAGTSDLYVKSLAGSGEEVPLLVAPGNDATTDWSPDGRHILFERQNPGEQQNDIWALTVADGKAAPIVSSSFEEKSAVFSPDGRFIAYTSGESGRDDVYVQPFPGSGARTLVSTGGGSGPRWLPDGTEICYLSPENVLMAAPVRPGNNSEIGTPRVLFETNIRDRENDMFDISPDGKQFLINESLAEDSAPPMSLVLNWTAAQVRR